MSARLLNARSSLLALLGDIRYTLSRLKADPIGAPFVAAFQQLRDEWAEVQAQEIENQEELSEAQARVDIADTRLDAFAHRVSKAVLTLVKDDRTHPLYLHFFGDKSQSVLARPKVGIEVLAMRPWLTSVENSPHPSLQAMAAELGLLILAADKALTARDAVKDRIRTFYDVGARRRLFDKCNGLRRSTHGELSRLAQEQGGLPSTYAGGFFRADSGEAMPQDSAMDPVSQRFLDLGTKVAAAKVQLEKLEAAAQEERKQADEKLSNEQKLATIRRQQEELAEAARELEEKLK